MTVALLLDEMYSSSIAMELRRRGHDVIAVQERLDLRSASDADVLEWANRDRRVVVTENVRDYRRQLAARGAEQTGCLYVSARSFPRTRRRAGAIIAALDQWLTKAHDHEHPVEEWLVAAK